MSDLVRTSIKFCVGNNYKGLTRNCTTKDIREAYIQLSKKYHPDKNATHNSHKKFVKVLEAYSVLSKPDKRRFYDWQLTHTTVRSEDFQEAPIYRKNPGGGSMGYGYDDPSFWANRDKSRDRYYQDIGYYGVRGIRKVSNGFIALICVIITTIGITLQILTIRHSVTLKRDALIKASRENERVLAEIKEQATRNGNERQIEILEERFRNNKYYHPKQ